ncbi:hypothetical protein BKA63DRAFT_485904 [Paraphoma chrysanthemicola]|nr:hypothetical protein BKA63DRAFT_485904 [Paraphoma chrysanthemicola]
MSELECPAALRNDLTKPQHFRFLDLPAELRNAVYKELLAVGNMVFQSGCAASSDNQKPQLALLRACKRIHAEPEPVYLTKNLFHLPTNWPDCLPFERLIQRTKEPSPRQLFSRAGLNLIRSIRIAFGPRQLTPMDHWGDFKHYEKAWGPGSYHALTSEERFAEAAELAHYVAPLNWEDIQTPLEYFDKKLDNVHMEFKHVFCPIGCCRPVITLMEHMLRGWKPENVTISGLLDGEEDDILDYLCNIFTLEELASCDVQFEQIDD